MSQEESRRLNIVLYSDDVTVRAHVAAALGTRVAPDLAPHSITEFATGPALRLYVDGKARSGDHEIDLFILDGEAAPEGGMGVARQLKDELFNCPPVLGSRAEANVLHPIDPFTLAHTVADLLRSSIARIKA